MLKLCMEWNAVLANSALLPKVQAHGNCPLQAVSLGFGEKTNKIRSYYVSKGMDKQKIIKMMGKENKEIFHFS